MRKDKYPKFKLSNNKLYQFEVQSDCSESEWYKFLSESTISSVFCKEEIKLPSSIKLNINEYLDRIEREYADMDCGFIDEFKKNFKFDSECVYAYFKGGCVYCVDFEDGHLYIGNTMDDNDSYFGSGGAVVDFIRNNGGLKKTKTIIKGNFNNEYEMRLFECKSILENKDNELLINNKINEIQTMNSFNICEECYGMSSNHHSDCSKASICQECGGKNGQHVKGVQNT